MGVHAQIGLIFIRIGLTCAAAFVLAFLIVALGASRAQASSVYVIDVHGDIAPVLAQFVTQSIDEAASAHASAVILDIDTDGGILDSAYEIQRSIYSHEGQFPIVGFVHNRAFSSGALITLSCQYIAMTRAGTLGSALPHYGDDTNPNKELIQAIQNKFKSMASARKRNQDIAVAMVTAKNDIPSLGVKKDDILSLTESQAKANGYCDIEAQSAQDILANLKLSGSSLVTKDESGWQSFSLFLLNPWITIFLIGIGMALIIAEAATMHSSGLLAGVGFIFLILVFAVHIGAGSGSLYGLILFLAGIALFLVETHLFPGHGIATSIGLFALFGGMWFALGGSHTNAIVAVVGSLLVTVGSLVAFLVYLPKSPVWRKIGQNMQQTNETGYVASADFSGYIGQRGVSITTLRPSGAVDLSGTRLNVVTNGEFLAPGTVVEVVNVQGSRIVVEKRELDAASREQNPDEIRQKESG
jgi:membrane-bound serine protease (ClpP class)